MKRRAPYHHPTRWERRHGRKPAPVKEDLCETIRAVNAAFPAWLLRTTGTTWVEGAVYLQATMHHL